MAKIVSKFIEDNITFGTNPRYAADPSVDNDLARKKYVDDQIGAISLPSVFELKGNWNGTTNSPALDDTDTSVDGFLYYVNVAGSQDFGAGSITFSVGDWVYNTNGAWEKADNNDDVLSVAGKTGIVTLVASDITDFDTEVGNNSAVALNTAKVSADGLVTTHSDVTSAGSGIIISGAERTKLDGIAAGAEVNADLASQAEAEAGSENTKTMTALRVAQAITEQGAVALIAGREVLTLSAGDITNGYVELAQPAKANSLSVTPIGGIAQEPSVDFTESIVVTNTRVTFAGDLLELAAADKLLMEYMY